MATARPVVNIGSELAKHSRHLYILFNGIFKRDIVRFLLSSIIYDGRDHSAHKKEKGCSQILQVFQMKYVKFIIVYLYQPSIYDRTMHSISVTPQHPTNFGFKPKGIK